MAKTREEIEKMGKYYIENNVTYGEAAEHFGVSKRSFQLYMKKLKEISESTFKLVQDKKKANLIIGAKKGGSISRTDSPNVGKKHTITDEELNHYADLLINGDLSLRRLSGDIGIPKSTLYDNLVNRIIDPNKKETIVNLFQEHKPENNKKGKK